MKASFFTLSLALGTVATVWGQGQITFNSNPVAAILVQDGTGLRPPAPGSFMVGLYLSADTSAPADTFTLVPNSVTPIGPAGTFLGGIKSIDGITGGTPIVAEIRAWTAGYDSYEAAIASASLFVFVGRSGVLPNQITLANPGNPPPNVTTAGGFSGMVIIVPEPSTVALGIIGGLGILWGMGRGSNQKRARSARGPSM